MALEDDDHHQQQQHPIGIETSQSSPESAPPLLTEIVTEILSRLPVDSLLRCRSVCKLWRSIISDPYFVNSHLTLSSRNDRYSHHRLIYSTRRKLNLKACVLYDLLYDKCINDSTLYNLLKFTVDPVWIVGSCNGLVCVVSGEDNVFIWNPSIRKSNKLPYHDCTESTESTERPLSVNYGFGYEECSDDYKVVEICCVFKDRFRYRTVVRVYSLRNGSWKSIGSFPHGMPFDYFGKFSNGALHWAAGKDFGLSYSWTIVCLDLSTETYGEVLQPVYDVGDKDLTLGSLREWLCVLCNYHEVRVDLWVMKVYGVRDSWTKLVSIPYLSDPEGDRFSVPLCVSNDGKFLLEFGSKLIVYDSKNGSLSEIRNFDECVQASTFVESLVSPMPPAGLGDRSCLSSNYILSKTIHCWCGEEAMLRTSWTTRNPGRRFYGCPKNEASRCRFFRWYDPQICQRSTEIISGLLRLKNHLEEKVKALEKEKRNMKRVLLITLFCVFVVVVVMKLK